MGYFSNGSEGMALDAECIECAAFTGCPIALVQLMYNYDQVGNQLAGDILNTLVKQKDGEYIGCQMKKIIDEIAKG